MFQHERAIKCLKLFIHWIGSKIAHDQNLADYTPADAEQKLHVAVIRYLEEKLDDISPKSGYKFRNLCFTSVSILKDEDSPIIMIQTRGGGMSSFIQPLEGKGTKSHRDYLVSYLDSIAVNRDDLHIYETGTMCDRNMGINIVGDTAKEIFQNAGVAMQVKMATEKALADRGWKKTADKTNIQAM